MTLCNHNEKKKKQQKTFFKFKIMTLVSNNIVVNVLLNHFWVCWKEFNGEFMIRNVVYVEYLQHNLISIFQLVVGTGLKGSFDEERLLINQGVKECSSKV